ncbi:RCC1 domain-containing protein [Solwaraspora sp. WMMA2101]|uniref:RCC1 domain-containing protein n=1 Tax=Solwaraspora sp. WMMA2101 TaxID=3404124 RepID=UPI003B9351C1
MKEVATGYAHSLALRGDGGVVAWGSNTSGQLGNGLRTAGIPVPARVCALAEVAPCARFLYGVRHIDAGHSHSLAQLSSGGVLAWGANRAGQLGDGTHEHVYSRPVPVRVCEVGQTAPCTQYLTLIRSIASGTDRNVALRVDYTVAVWGDYPGKLLSY